MTIGLIYSFQWGMSITDYGKKYVIRLDVYGAEAGT
jgi:hypothetical protein